MFILSTLEDHPPNNGVGMQFRNATDAFLAKLDDIAHDGVSIQVRGHMTREIRNQALTLKKPLERCIVIPERRNNIFAAIAETMWVISGRNDLSFLRHYLPRSSDFSDDGGVTWRAAYGPRLRSWHGSIDQIEEVVKILTHAESSRRGVVALYDPGADFRDSNDVPCTNWLHFTIRDGELDLNVTVRSNDLVWGFSGINTFEWSVLQEMVAHWLGKSVGETTFFISSLHLYESHYSRASRILAHHDLAGPGTPLAGISQFDTSFVDLPAVLSQFFTVEESIRACTPDRTAIATFCDPLFRDFLKMLDAYWTFQRGDEMKAREIIRDVTDPDLILAGESYFDWKTAPPEPTNDQHELMPAPLSARQVQQFVLDIYHKGAARDGDSWKYRGEKLSVLPKTGIAFDRLMYLSTSHPQRHGQIFEAAVDLLICSLSHQQYLQEASKGKTSTKSSLGESDTTPIGHLIKEHDLGKKGDTTFGQDILAVQRALTEVEDGLASGVPLIERIAQVELLSLAAAQLLSGLVVADLGEVHRLVRKTR